MNCNISIKFLRVCLVEILALCVMIRVVLKVHTNMSEEYAAAVFRVELSGVYCGEFMWPRL